jgi:general secretion pathway protein H
MLKLVIGMQNRSSCGFTLIEIMVVILIVGITLGFALLAFGDFGSQRRVLMAAEQFVNYVTFVEQQAILGSSTLGIRINPNGYQVLRYQSSEKWLTMSKQSSMREQYFPSNTIVSISNGIEDKNSPQIIIQSSGDITPFTLTFSTKAQENIVSVSGRHDGTVELQRQTNS